MKPDKQTDYLESRGTSSVIGSEKKLYYKQVGLDLFKKHILFFHDLGEYHGRYKDFCEFFIKKEIGISFVDMRGHGLSSGTRGHIDSLDELISDYNNFWQTHKKQYEDKEVIVIGHGVGALIAMVFMLDNLEVEGLAMVNPAIKFTSKQDSKVEGFLANYPLLNKIKVSSQLHGDEISEEKLVSNSHEHDPLVNKKITIKTYQVIQELLNQVKHSSYFITRPVLYAMGMEDRVIDLEMSELFSSSIDQDYLTLKKYNDLGHELFNELDRDKAFKDIYNWINNNFKK